MTETLSPLANTAAAGIGLMRDLGRRGAWTCGLHVCVGSMDVWSA